MIKTYFILGFCPKCKPFGYTKLLIPFLLQYASEQFFLLKTENKLSTNYDNIWWIYDLIYALIHAL